MENKCKKVDEKKIIMDYQEDSKFYYVTATFNAHIWGHPLMLKHAIWQAF